MLILDFISGRTMRVLIVDFISGRTMGVLILICENGSVRGYGGPLLGASRTIYRPSFVGGHCVDSGSHVMGGGGTGGSPTWRVCIVDASSSLMGGH